MGVCGLGTRLRRYPERKVVISRVSCLTRLMTVESAVKVSQSVCGLMKSILFTELHVLLPLKAVQYKLGANHVCIQAMESHSHA